jgi:outer membrane receptor protein involved in Fe transport
MKKLTSFAVFVCFFRIIAAQEITLPPIFTYIEDSLVEQKEVLTAEDISRANVTDLPSLLSSAGIQILSYGAYGLEQKPSMRGFTDETVRVIIDGICVNNPQYGTFDFTSLNLEDIERIEIVRGGFTESVSDEGAAHHTVLVCFKG